MMFKKFLIILGIVALVGLIAYFAINRNKETIIDLGNGWKSYSHSQIGFTVKIPSDAEAEYEVQGDKKDSLVVSFSKGLISFMRASTSSGCDNIIKDCNQNYLDFINYTGEEENEWRTYKLNRGRSFMREFTIAGKKVLVKFDEDEIGNKGKDILLRFEATRILIVGKTRVHSSVLNNFFTQTTATSDHPHYTQEEIEEFIKQDVEKIKELIISIDNF